MTSPPSKSPFTLAKEYAFSWYREYEFTTAVYLLEPWEKNSVNTAMTGIVLFSLYATYHYLPHYASTFAQYAGIY